MREVAQGLSLQRSELGELVRANLAVLSDTVAEECESYTEHEADEQTKRRLAPSTPGIWLDRVIRGLEHRYHWKVPDLLDLRLLV